MEEPQLQQTGPDKQPKQEHEQDAPVVKDRLSGSKLVLVVLLILAVAGAGAYTWFKSNQNEASISSFAECADAGKPVLTSYPEQCSANGQTWANPEQDLSVPGATLDSDEEYNNFISQVNDHLESNPVRFTGKTLQIDELRIRLKLTTATVSLYSSVKDSYAVLGLTSPEYNTEYGGVAAISKYETGDLFYAGTGEAIGRVEDIYEEHTKDPEVAKYWLRKAENYYRLDFGNGGDGCGYELACGKEHGLIRRDLLEMFRGIEEI